MSNNTFNHFSQYIERENENLQIGLHKDRDKNSVIEESR